MKREGAGDRYQTREQSHQEREEERNLRHAARRAGNYLPIESFTRPTLTHLGPPQVRERRPSREVGQGSCAWRGDIGRRGVHGVSNLPAIGADEGCPASHVTKWETFG